MSVKITHNNYGKSQIRILKVTRDKPVHEIKEFTVNILFDGDFDTAHTRGDNSKVLPTDTMKNTVYALAKKHSILSIEEFGLYIAEHFKDNNSQVSKIMVDIEEKLWQRIITSSSSSQELHPHDHSFLSSGNERRTAKIILNKGEKVVHSGLKDLLVLKTTGSAFKNFIKDTFTTLQETSDRVFSTSVRAEWLYTDKQADYNHTYMNIRNIVLERFANHHSLSVQQTLYETGKKIIEELKEISEISISMPNKHYLLYNLNQFGMDNNNEIFIPTDEPFGLIEATLKREN